MIENQTQAPSSLNKGPGKGKRKRVVTTEVRMFRSLENCLALLIGLGTVFVIAVCLIAFGSSLVYPEALWAQATVQKVLETAKNLGDSWRILLVLLVPLFYRPVRQFLEEAHELGPGGAKRPRKPKHARKGRRTKKDVK